MAPPIKPAFGRELARSLSEDVALRDGRRVRLRPIQAEDAELLVELHERLSPESRYLRFFAPAPRLPRRMAEYLAGVDFADRFAIVATTDEDGAECIVAVGRFDVAPDDAVAESALVVRDDYQGVGLGTAVFGRLLDLAQARGVRRLTGHVLAHNRRMLDLLRSRGISAAVSEAGVVQFGVPVDDPPSVLSVLGILARHQAPSTSGVAAGPTGAAEASSRGSSPK